MEVPAAEKIAWQEATVTAIVEQTPTVKSFFLKPPVWPPFMAGQHVDVRLTAPDGYHVTVRLCCRYRAATDCCSCALSVVDHHGLIDALAHIVTDDPGNRIRWSSWGERHDQLDWTVGIGLCHGAGNAHRGNSHDGQTRDFSDHCVLPTRRRSVRSTLPTYSLCSCHGHHTNTRSGAECSRRHLLALRPIAINRTRGL